MNTKPITLETITPIELVIENLEPPTGNTDLQLNLERKFTKLETGFNFQLIASIFKESEINVERKSIFLKYSLEAHFSDNSEELSIEDLYREATNILYPFIRSGVSGAMGAIGLKPILLPSISIN